MIDLALGFGLAGIVGAAISVSVAALPPIREWYYDTRNKPLKVEVERPVTKVNPSAGAQLKIIVHNRLRSAVCVQVSPATNVTVRTDSAGKVEVKGTVFDKPEPCVYPSMEKAWTFWLPGHDTREVILRLPVAPGLLHGRESVSPVVFASRFRVQEIRLGPFEFEVDPTYH